MEKNYNKKQLKEFVKNNGIKTGDDLANTMKDLYKDLIEVMLEGELDNHLGYDKHDYVNKETTNSRNGKYNRSIKSSFGDVVLNMPRDREGSFQADLLPKYQGEITKEIESKVISMYSHGMTTRDISDHIQDIYGMSLSAQTVSNITDQVIDLAKEWQSRPLESIYPFIYMDGIQYSVRTNGKVIKRTCYVVIGINLDGRKDILGFYIGENESSKFWLSVLTDMKNRGVQDILIASVDGLNGFPDAIRSVFPNAEIQRCIVHQIRASLRYVPHYDSKEFARDLKNIYNSPNHESGFEALEKLKSKWGTKYPVALNSWYEHWNELSTLFSYSPEIRKIMYTTNTIESVNRQYRKVTKSKSIFPTDESLLKMLYLATIQITKKWTMPVRNWRIILGQLQIRFEDRLKI